MRTLIRDMVHRTRQCWRLRFTGLDETIANSIVNGLNKMLARNVCTNPEHPLRAASEEALANLAWDLQYDPEMQGQGRRRCVRPVAR